MGVDKILNLLGSLKPTWPIMPEGRNRDTKRGRQKQKSKRKMSRESRRRNRK